MQKMKLSSLAEGAIEESFDREMSRVIKNIEDLSTSSSAVRVITIQVKIKPGDDRATWVAEGKVTSKLAPAKGIITQGYFDLDASRKIVAVEHKKPEPIGLVMDRDAKAHIKEVQKEVNQPNKKVEVV